MKTHQILFSIGVDRPGIVDDVSTSLFKLGANILDSRMSVMGGCFSIMTLFSCEEERLAIVRDDMAVLRDLGLETSLHDADEPSTAMGRGALPLRIDVTAMDNPGIVQKIVHVFHLHNVNIQSLNTRVLKAPLSGAPLFNLRLEAAVPPESSISELKERLLAQAAEMNFDLNFTGIEP